MLTFGATGGRALPVVVARLWFGGGAMALSAVLVWLGLAWWAPVVAGVGLVAAGAVVWLSGGEERGRPASGGGGDVAAAGVAAREGTADGSGGMGRVAPVAAGAAEGAADAGGGLSLAGGVGVDGLDEDLDLWWSQSCPVPRLAVLGRVEVVPGAGGGGLREDMARRLSYLRELAVLLASRPGGLTAGEVRRAMGTDSEDRVRKDVAQLRAWLGSDPRTGELFVPKANTTQGYRSTGVARYVVRGVLVDADLFARLRGRARDSGEGGDRWLVEALRLVRGAPFDRLRSGGGGWLSASDREVLAAEVADTARRVRRAALEASDPALARRAAELADLCGRGLPEVGGAAAGVVGSFGRLDGFY